MSVRQNAAMAFLPIQNLMAYKVLYVLTSASLSNHSSRTLSLSQAAPATLLVSYAEPASVSGPLHLLFPLS